MLSSLHIENVAVILKADLDLNPGFTVLTGETGAGKSMILDSINMLLGARTSKDIIRTGEERALVSAYFTDLSDAEKQFVSSLGFEIEDDSVMLQRTLDQSGKSVCKLDGRTIPIGVQKQIAGRLINIHGQHDTGALLDPKNHVSYLDSYAGADMQTISDEYKVHYAKMTSIRREMQKFMTDEREKQRKIELLSYQIEDIESADLEEGEDERLLSERTALKNARQITKNASTVYRALYKNEKGFSADKLIEIAKNSLDNLSDSLPEAGELSDRLFDIEYELQSIAEKALALIPSGAERPEARLSEIEDRLDTINKLKRKYGSTVKEVLDYLADAKAQMEKIEKSDELLETYEKELTKETEDLTDLSKKIRELRRKTGEKLSFGITDSLRYLDMEKVRFAVSCEKTPEFRPDGADEVQFLIATNPGEPLRPLSSIASGGELSRIMLAIKCVLLKAEEIPTVIFDEVDTGVSGKTSQKIGIRLRNIAKYTQTICVTHSAQIAALAHNHYRIEKTEKDGRAVTVVRTLDKEGRIAEIARIMGGVDISAKIKESAEEMVLGADQYDS